MSSVVGLLFAQLSTSIAAIVAQAAPSLTAIRVGANRHVSGILWDDNSIVTLDQALPAQDTYSVVLSHGALLPARLCQRDPGANLALLQLDAPAGVAPLPKAAEAAVGGLVLVLASAADASPTCRLAAIHRLERRLGTAWADTALDIPGSPTDDGGPVLDAQGGLLGIAQTSGLGVGVLPYELIAHFCGARRDAGVPVTVGRHPASAALPARAAPARVPLGPRRGWLGVALQPITVPDALVARAGQSSGRMVVNVTTGGPADRAGVRVGDVLLALNGHNTSGPHALRAFLESERIGSEVEVRLLRDGAVLNTYLIVEAQPAVA